jgi:hypothetical protein
MKTALKVLGDGITARIIYDHTTTLSEGELDKLYDSPNPPEFYELKPVVYLVEFIQTSYKKKALQLDKYQYSVLKAELKRIEELESNWLPLADLYC